MLSAWRGQSAASSANASPIGGLAGESKQTNPSRSRRGKRGPALEVSTTEAQLSFPFMDEM
jgi:hypothetical protein